MSKRQILQTCDDCGKEMVWKEQFQMWFFTCDCPKKWAEQKLKKEE